MKTRGALSMASGLLSAVLLLSGLPGCGGETGAGAGGSGGSGGGGSGGGSGTTTEAALHALRVTVTLTAGEKGVEIIAQNGASVFVPAADIAGKNVWWATTPGGEPINGSVPIELGGAIMKDDLTAEISTDARYSDGPWEMSLFISVAGKDINEGPQDGDLAAFDNSPPPEGQPPVTGSSIRMTVGGADAQVTLENEHFVEF